MLKRRFIKKAFWTCLAAILTSVVISCTASTPEVTLKVHHFLPTTSTSHQQFIEPWAEAIAADSGGRIKVEIYPTMQLGGKPPQLFDQVRDGVVDVAWTLPGYTPGRFPTVEVFELPFMAASAEATSQAVQEFYQRHLKEEFQDVHPLVFYVHAPGSFHMNGKPIQSLDDLKGVKVRAPTRVTNNVLQVLGATPVGMPLPEVPEAVAKGVVDGTLLPYEVTRPLRVHELTDSHTEFGGDRGLYTAVFLFAMNKAKYESLPETLKKVIDDHSGLALAQQAGQILDQAEAPGRQAAEDLGDTFYTIEEEELERWRVTAEPVIDAWVAAMNAQGKDGEALLAEARALVSKYADESQ
ncbi:MAG: TRAP transporter substrate-binding protein [Pseudanabaenales cyanobacterium]|nr:TRAP transporter substrate-binding protein [Pseudanabaenales cyanobacterium]